MCPPPFSACGRGGLATWTLVARAALRVEEEGGGVVRVQGTSPRNCPCSIGTPGAGLTVTAGPGACLTMLGPCVQIGGGLDGDGHHGGDEWEDRNGMSAADYGRTGPVEGWRDPGGVSDAVDGPEHAWTAGEDWAAGDLVGNSLACV